MESKESPSFTKSRLSVTGPLDKSNMSNNKSGFSNIKSAISNNQKAYNKSGFEDYLDD